MSKQSLGRVAMVPKGAYSALTAYERLDVVTHDGASYIVLRPVQGVTPVDGEDYMLLVQDGDIGATPVLKMGKVTTLEAGSEASASLSGTAAEPVLNLNIPRGASGGVDVASAEVGQIPIVKAVDEHGKPTEWEAADMAAGENWELIREITLEEAVTTVTINQDTDGNAFALSKLRMILEGSAESRIDIHLNGVGYFRYTFLATTASVAGISVEPFGNKMLCTAHHQITAWWDAKQVYSNVFGPVITISDVRLTVNNAATLSAGTKIRLYGVRA